ncbi:alpha/beta fold hydrolase [Nocardia sp. NPDC005978]|uniref:alpha/beta fold hydrolase n=1 Tax=Nocardia sp. NPDC005978 TaxID=3156725 RepID=UPI0033AA90CF
MTHADSIVFGAAGFIGRSLVAELLRDGHTVVAAVRAGSGDRLTSWLAEQGADQRALLVATADITAPNLGLTADFHGIRDVYNTAALMKFGLDAERAQRVNLTGALDVARWASRQPELRRLIHISGYRVTAEGGAEADYRAGAYEASKTEADRALRELARQLGVPLTVANPASVLGPGQYFGLSDLVDQLWRGQLPALPGRRDSFVPIVGIDYVARFLARVATLPETADRAYTLLDPATPDLPDLIRLIAAHLGVRAPRLRIPVPVLRALPRVLTGAEPESLGFISGDRYDTSAADAVARTLGIEHRPFADVLRDWADGVVATRNGVIPERTGSGFRDGTWVSGDAADPEYVLLHGLPLDSDSWDGVTKALAARTLSADLPGFGRSAPRPGSLGDWLGELMAPVRTRPVLVGHSLGAAAAVDYAERHPDRVSRVVLISPFFLQKRAPWTLRNPLTARVLKRLPASKLAAQLDISNGSATASAHAALRRPGAAARVVSALSAVSAPAYRTDMATRLSRLRVPVLIIHGAQEPLLVSTMHPVVAVPGAGHNPHITHPELIAGLVAEPAPVSG